HHRAAQCDPAPRDAPRIPARDSRRGLQSLRPAAGMQIPPALYEGAGDLPNRNTTAGRKIFRQPRGLSFSWCLMPLLEVKQLTKYFDVSDGLVGRWLAGGKTLKAVDQISFDVAEGKTFGLVGE